MESLIVVLFHSLSLPESGLPFLKSHGMRSAHDDDIAVLVAFDVVGRNLKTYSSFLQLNRAVMDLGGTKQ